ncbi:MAG: AI-2E family transporter [Haloarculaceae archaeon]
MRRRTSVLVSLLVVLSVATGLILRQVLGTVFFAITVAYVLLPLRRDLARRGFSRRIASAVATALAFVGVVLLAAPFVVVLSRRWETLVRFLRELPNSIPIEVVGVVYTVDVEALVTAAASTARTVGIQVLRASPVLAMKVVLFAFVVYGLLLKPDELRAALFELAPDGFHDVLVALHDRTNQTLRALYVLQLATAVATFVVALVVFFVLGYPSPLVLALIAGVLQFIPIVGPSVLVLALAAFDLVVGNPVRAFTVTAVGLVVVGFLPDAIVRPRLASQSTHLPASLYFVGFTGGVLTLGAVGFIAGPLVVALLVEAVELVSASSHPTDGNV